MTLRAKATLVAVLLATPLAAATVARAAAPPSGGAAPTSGASSGSGGASITPTGIASLIGSWGATPTALLATATGDGIAVTTRIDSMMGHRLSFIGIAVAAPGATVVGQRLTSKSTWVNVATATVGVGGTFWLKWIANYSGVVTIRTVLEQTATASEAGAPSATIQTTVYRPAVATYYGNGFFGHRTACGKILTRSTVGVANRTLKCGTRVQVYYDGHTVVVPVIDRGPYANDADWDLTQATAQSLGISGTETIGVIPL